MKKQIQKSQQNQDNQFHVGTPPFVLRLARQIQEAAKTAGLKATVANIGQLQYLRIRRQDKTWLFVDIVDVPAWNYDDRPRPLATPEVVLWCESILSILPSFTQALCALGIAHRYAFVGELDSHLALAFNPNADVEAVDANVRISQIVSYRRRTRRRILAQGYPPIGAVRTGRKGYHRNGNSNGQPEAKTAFGKANQRLHRSGVRVYAN